MGPVQAVRYVARSTMRSRRASIVALALAIGVIGGLALASVAGAARGRSSLPDFVEFHRAPDAFVFPTGSAPRATVLDWKQQIDALPYVEAVGEESFALMAVEDDGGTPVVGAAGAIGASASVDEDSYRTMSRLHVVEGTLPPTSSRDRVAVDEDLAAHFGIGVGDELPVRLYGTGQLEHVGNARPVAPSGPHVELTVDAIVRSPLDVLIDTFNAPGTLFEVNRRSLYLMPGFWTAYGDEIANYGVGMTVALESDDDLPALRAAAREITEGQVIVDNEGSPLAGLGPTQRSIDLEANALLVFGALVGFVGLTLIGLALGRQSSLTEAEQRPLRAVGLTRVQQLVSALARPVLVAVTGAALAVVLAAALSPATPIGLAELAELAPGFRFDPVVLLGGAAIVCVYVLVVSTVTIGLSLHRANAGSRAVRPSRLCEALAGAGAAPPLVTVMRMVVDGGGRDRAAAVRTTIGVAAIGVAAVLAAMGVAQSLDHLVTTPRLWGWGWDVAVGNYSKPSSANKATEALALVPEVEDAVGLQSTLMQIDGRTVPLAALDDDARDPMLNLLEGSIPTQKFEVALGRSTLEDVGVAIGETVMVADPGGDEVPLRVVGVVTPPAPLVTDMTIGEGAVVTTDTFQELAPKGVPRHPVSHLVRFAPGVAVEDGIESLRADFADTVVQQTSTPDVESVRRVRLLPQLLAALLACLATGALVHTFTSSVRNRRRELGILKSIGFDRGQIRATMTWQATTIAVLALLIGVPVGLVIARLGWLAVADAMGTDLPTITPALGVALVVPTVILLANVAAARPGRAAANAPAMDALRVE